MMEQWKKLKLAEQEELAAKYGITRAGEPNMPINEEELKKVPEHEWDARIQKEVPKRRKKPAPKVVKKVSKEVKKVQPKKPKKKK